MHGFDQRVSKNKNGDRLFPSWKEFLEKSIEKLRANDKEPDANIVYGLLNRKQPDYLQAARYAREGFETDWNSFLYSQFNPERRDVDESSLEIGKLIWQLGSSLIITTNYDKVLKWTNDSVEIWDIESRFSQGKLLSKGLPKEPTVWHLHGYIENPSDIILTPDGYQRLYPVSDNSTETKYKTAITTLRTLLASYTFLFIGFSLSDVNLVNQIKEINDLFDSATENHFVLVKEPEARQINSLNLPIKPITYSENGEPLISLLRNIINSSSSYSKNSPQETRNFHFEGNQKTVSVRKLSQRVTSLTFIVETNAGSERVETLESIIIMLIKRNLPTKQTTYNIQKIADGYL